MRPNLERLQILLDYLRTRVDAQRFDLREWFANRDDPESLIGDAQIGDCGTTACAIGYACVIPEFQAAGFSLRNSVTPCYRIVLPDGQVYERTHWEAAEEFFNLHQTQARALFAIHCSGSLEPSAARNTLAATCHRLESFINAH